MSTRHAIPPTDQTSKQGLLCYDYEAMSVSNSDKKLLKLLVKCTACSLFVDVQCSNSCTSLRSVS
jgi:hypothetical protein